jgi:hypothetical protein
MIFLFINHKIGIKNRIPINIELNQPIFMVCSKTNLKAKDKIK